MALMWNLIGLLALASLAVAKVTDLDLLCNGKNVKLTTVSQVVGIIELSKTENPEGCNPKLLEALKDLEPILTEDMNDVCTVQKAKQILAFHKKHISKKSWQLFGNKLPESLKIFVQAFGLKVSKVCRDAMQKWLLIDGRKQMDESYQGFLKVSGDLLRTIRSNMQDHDDIVLLSEISRARPGAPEKLYVQTTFNVQARKIQAVCERQFKPYYDRLVLPFVLLLTNGYSLRGKKLKVDLEELRSSLMVNRWIEISLLCQTLDKVETFEPDENSKRNVRILMQTEAGDLRLVQEEQIQQLAAEAGPQIVYQPPEGNSVGDLIVDKDDSAQMKQIKGIEFQKKAMRSIGRRLLYKYADKLRKLLLSRSDISFISSLFKSNKRADKLDILYAVDVAVDGLETDDVFRRAKALTTSEGLVNIFLGLGVLTVTLILICIVMPAFIG